MGFSNIHIKKPKTHHQQIDILMKRNLIIEDMDEAQSFLKRVNYYRFSAYGLTLKQESNKDLFKHGVTFNRMKMIYNFDQKLRELLMSYLEPIEIEFRTRISYYHAHEFGSLGYKKSDNFVSSEVHEEFLKKLNDQIDRSNKELFVMHHKSKYRGEFPFWVAIEVISFGELSKLFRNLHDMIKVKVVKDFNVPHYYVTSWLHTLTYVRNVCAHYGRLYGKRLVIKPQYLNPKET